MPAPAWRRHLAAALAVLAAAFAVLRPAALEPAAADSPDGWVVVRYHSRSVTAQSLDGAARSLPERGYRVVPVPRGEAREAFLERLRKDPAVASAEADAPVWAAALPNDAFYAQNQSPYLSMLGAPRAWDLHSGSRGVVVAVLDSGIDLGHDDLSAQLWENPLEVPGDGLDNDGNGCVDDQYGCRFLRVTPERQSACGYLDAPPNGDIRDDNGRPGSATHSHGTSIAGIIGATGDNLRGVAGVAWNIRIMPIKVLDCGIGRSGPGGDMSNVAQGIDYARRMGANIINLSLASAPGDASADLAILRDAIAAAEAQGILIVTAAGNRATDSAPAGVGYPAAYQQYSNLVAVGASDWKQANGWASYSNYGPPVDLAAPGSEIASTVRRDLVASGYGVAQRGTSFATAIVTGMFALMESRNSRIRPVDLIEIARQTARPAAAAPHGQNWAGAGIVDIGAAVARVPMTVAGAALRDWKDVPVGTQVRAVIGGLECAATTTTSFGVTTRYSLRVKAAGEQEGCGAPGLTVQIVIAGVAATPAIPWGGRNEDLGLLGRDVSTVSPAAGSLVVQPLREGWNNVGHVDPAGAVPGALAYLPEGWTTVAQWRPGAEGGSFVRASPNAPAYARSFQAVQQFDTFWVRGPTGNAAQVNPNPPTGRVLELKRGWNNFVYTGTSAAVGDALKDIAGKWEQVLRFDNTIARWESHLPGQARYLNDFGGLLKLQVYWVFMREDALLTMR